MSKPDNYVKITKSADFYKRIRSGEPLYAKKETTTTPLTNKNLYRKVSEGIDLEDEDTLAKINEFLHKYPDTKEAKEDDKTTTWTELSVKELYKRCIQTAIDIINDISDILSNKSTTDNTSFRRLIFYAFTKPERRLYLGFWLIFISFILYFIDSAT